VVWRQQVPSRFARCSSRLRLLPHHGLRLFRAKVAPDHRVQTSVVLGATVLAFNTIIFGIAAMPLARAIADHGLCRIGSMPSSTSGCCGGGPTVCAQSKRKLPKIHGWLGRSARPPQLRSELFTSDKCRRVNSSRTAQTLPQTSSCDERDVLGIQSPRLSFSSSNTRHRADTPGCHGCAGSSHRAASGSGLDV
jgi:hypothetical protein